MRAAERPLLIAGGGVRYSEAQEPSCARSSARLGIPVARDVRRQGRAAGRRSSRWAAIGSRARRAANALAREADLVLVRRHAADRLHDRARSSLFQDPDVRFVGVNVAPRDAHKLGALPVVARRAAGLRALREALGGPAGATRRRWRERARDERARWERELEPDLRRGAGERMTQGQALRVAQRAAAGPGDWWSRAAGTPAGRRAQAVGAGARRALPHRSSAYSCMGTRSRPALGVRWRGRDAGEVYVVIGDGTYLMGNTASS